MKKSTKQRSLSLLLFSIYLVLLVWVILFKMSLNAENFPSMVRYVNWVPYAGSAVINGHVDTQEWLLNILIYIPFGLLLSMIFPKMKFSVKLLLILLSTVALEGAQYYFAIGRTDITDVINNTLGGLIGLIMYDLLELVFRKKERLNTFLNVVGCLLAIAFFIFIAVVALSNT